MFVLGAYVPGANPSGEFTIVVRTNSSYNHSPYDLYTRDGSKKDDSHYISTSSDLQKKFVIETGFVQKNYWLEWVQNVARKVLANTSCVICAGPCPALLTVPSLLSDHPGKGLTPLLACFSDRPMPVPKHPGKGLTPLLACFSPPQASEHPRRSALSSDCLSAVLGFLEVRWLTGQSLRPQW
uniref:Uncharacterized protein n=1 Tax=Monopterus albus TaxID=43700 RepID=A0A3Q3KA83_MONAL